MKTTVVAMVCCLLSLSCGLQGDAASGSPVLRAYDVPNGAAPQVRGVLGSLLVVSDGDKSKVVGRSEVGPDGRLIVMAPEGVQRGVATLIDSLPKGGSKRGGHLELSYWFVLGAPGKAEPLTPELQVVAPALAEIEKIDGPRQFTLGEKLSVVSTDGERAKVEGRGSSVDQLATLTAQGISAAVTIDKWKARVQTRVNLVAGQTVVLGSTGAGDSDGNGPGSTLYFLIRATTHDGQGQ